MKKNLIVLGAFIFANLLEQNDIFAQAITGVWKGRVGNAKIELKLIKKGDSLVGTSYYYESKSSYQRYSVKGYFDDRDNTVIWWDDVLIENTSPRIRGQLPVLAEADFNCPGEGTMKLNGKTLLRDNSKDKKSLLNLEKATTSGFTDEWNYVLENYIYGANSPEVIDSVSKLAFSPAPVPAGYEEAPVVTVAPGLMPVRSNDEPATIKEPAMEKQGIPLLPASSLTTEQKFNLRTKILQQVIPVSGDSIELRFYDNAEIDGDSIAVFLNGKMLYEHILLSDRPYSIKIAVKNLGDDNELVMVAENMGTIPPNTSLMIAIVGDKRYEAHLQSTEGSSALVRFVKAGKRGMDQ